MSLKKSSPCSALCHGGTVHWRQYQVLCTSLHNRCNTDTCRKSGQGCTVSQYHYTDY